MKAPLRWKDICSGVSLESTHKLPIFDLAQQLFHSAHSPSVPLPYYTRINVISLNVPPENVRAAIYTHTHNIHSFWQGQIAGKSAEIYDGVRRVELIIWREVVVRGWVGVGGWGIESSGLFIIRPQALVQSCIS